MAETLARHDFTQIGVVNKLERTEFIIRQLQHRETSERGLRHLPDDDISDRRVELDGTVLLTDPQGDMKRTHAGALRSAVELAVVGAETVAVR